jgi:hypothetical protein
VDAVVVAVVVVAVVAALGTHCTCLRLGLNPTTSPLLLLIEEDLAGVVAVHGLRALVRGHVGIALALAALLAALAGR